MSDAPRARTADELRAEFIDNLRRIARYWLDSGESHHDTVDGVVFGILALIDGSTAPRPCAWSLVAAPHPDDKQRCVSEGRDWIEPGTDIAAGLREAWRMEP